MMDGFLNILKPPGMTSSDVVLTVRRMLPRGTKVGHGGTLDPDAAGVLPICVGRATRLFDYFIDKEKEYMAELTLGITTDTQDSTGKVVKVRDVRAGRAEVCAALPQFTGEILQTPPAFSAIQVGGKRLYDLARQGKTVEVAPRAVKVLSLDCLGSSGYNTYKICVVCRKGVYVRTLMHDIGEALGCGGHMSFLLRSRAGVFDVQGASTLEELAGAGVAPLLLPMDAPIEHLPRVELDASYLHAVKNGNPIIVPGVSGAGEVVRVYLNGVFAGIGQTDEGGAIRFRAMLLR